MNLPNVAISIQQPWARLIVNGVKDVENRTWRHKHRGPVLIHASRKMDERAAMAIRTGYHPVTLERLDGAADLGFDLDREAGGIVGMADLVDMVEDHASPWFVGPIGFVLQNARPLPFMPLTGALGIFKATYDTRLLKAKAA